METPLGGLTLRVGAAVRQWFDSFDRVDSATAMCQVDSFRQWLTVVDSGRQWAAFDSGRQWSTVVDSG